MLAAQILVICSQLQAQEKLNYLFSVLEYAIHTRKVESVNSQRGPMRSGQGSRKLEGIATMNCPNKEGQKHRTIRAHTLNVNDEKG